jgi:small subunit ribosomal protein S2
MSTYKIPDTKEMLEAGLHFGHQSRRWHPSMEKYIFAKTSKTHVIDLEKSYAGLEKACEFLYTLASQGKVIVFVGTKKQAGEIIKEEAKRAGAMYVTERWLGGTISNFKQLRKNMDKLIEQELGLKDGKYKAYTKKERLDIEREVAKLELMVGGIRNMKKIPDAVVIVDVRKEKTAVNEAFRVGIPIIGLVDTNSDPEKIEYVVPGNDDSIRSITLITKTFADAVEAGYKKYGKSVVEESGNLVIEEEKEAKVNIKDISTVQTFEDVRDVQEEVEEFDEQEKKVEATDSKEEAEVAEEIKSEDISTLEFSNRTLNALTNAGLTTLSKLKKLTEDEVKNIKGLGAKSIEEVLEKIK